MTSSISGSSPPVVRDKPRRQAITRACDRCRLRKARCDFDNTAKTCSYCRDNNVDCTFDLPLAKRGPKSRKRPHPSIPPEAVSTFSGCRSFPPPLSTLVRNNTPGTSSVTFGSPSNSSTPTTWEPPAPIGGGSTAATLSPASTWDFAIASPTSAPAVSAIKRWHNLARELTLQNKILEQVVERCFSLFFQYLYPLTPLIHEPSLREGFSVFASAPSISSAIARENASVRHGIPERIADALPSLKPPAWPRPSREMLSPVVGNEALPFWHEATFTLITAVCAEAAFLLPKELFPEGEAVADLFLQASRNCLSSYLEADLESPNADSITIRYFHSNCFHAAGKPKISWHIFGEATRLTQMMRLYDESSLEGVPPVEAEMRRRAFWIVYMGDKSAAILNHRPITMHKYSFETGITTAYPTGIGDGSSASASGSDVTTPSESHSRNFIIGFNANLKLWQTASDLIVQIRLFQDQKSIDLSVDDHASQALSKSERRRLDSLFVHFITCMDDLPPFLHASSTCPTAADSDIPSTEANQFAIQRANLHVSFHCLRMVITQKFDDIASSGAEQADLRKTEIVRDMLRVMHEAPFWSLQANGEPNVEKIRLAGATLLSIICRNQASPVAVRARIDFGILLNILTRLNSKASDALKSTSFLDL
ncbi:hypothetical protein E4U42_006023 [Claviceps africana]|uniref:Zn(2)-C6 fungal-type domain-containing protein n=1 Tax=Claviceps africana TaxID=83212 RepID=A0A8K0J8Z5_9HYPO|nr:hypothetical protein E4U42_006023 [Claviceps africana]